MRNVRLAILCTTLGVLLSLLLLVRETPYTLTAFMFLAQPLILLGMLFLGLAVVAELRRRDLL
jgi:hypothetical protein